MAKERLVKDNTAKVITVTNSVFETLTTVEENIIEKYQKMGYELQIVDDKKRKKSASNSLGKKELDNFFVKGSQELKEIEDEESYIELYKDLKEKSFQTAKGFYIELNKVLTNSDKKRHETVEEVYNYYLELLGA